MATKSPTSKKTASKAVTASPLKTIPPNRKEEKIQELQNDWTQDDLFNPKPKMIRIEIEAGTTVTFGGLNDTTSPLEAIRALDDLSPKEIYETVKSANLKTTTVTTLLKALHGELYHLAHIGAKITKGRAKAS